MTKSYFTIALYTNHPVLWRTGEVLIPHLKERMTILTRESAK